MTTRPPRDGEEDGVDYYFISEERFKNLDKSGRLAEKTKYRDWHYGTLKKDCTNDSVIVVNPHGLRQLKNIEGLDIISFYIRVSEQERLIRIAKRGDETMEIFRRIISDQGVFQHIEDDVDYVVDNIDLDKTVGIILKKIENHRKSS